MKKRYLLLSSVLFIVTCYLGSFLFGYSFYRIVQFIAVALTMLAIIFSGVLASGDRFRANYASNQQKTKADILTGWNIVVCAVPFYLVMLYIELLYF